MSFFVKIKYVVKMYCCLVSVSLIRNSIDCNRPNWRVAQTSFAVLVLYTVARTSFAVLVLYTVAQTSFTVLVLYTVALTSFTVLVLYTVALTSFAVLVLYTYFGNCMCHFSLWKSYT